MFLVALAAVEAQAICNIELTRSGFTGVVAVSSGGLNFEDFTFSEGGMSPANGASAQAEAASPTFSGESPESARQLLLDVRDLFAKGFNAFEGTRATTQSQLWSYHSSFTNLVLIYKYGSVATPELWEVPKVLEALDLLVNESEAEAFFADAERAGYTLIPGPGDLPVLPTLPELAARVRALPLLLSMMSIRFSTYQNVSAIYPTMIQKRVVQYDERKMVMDFTTKDVQQLNEFLSDMRERYDLSRLDLEELSG
ncbi:MAG: hypothetical protein HRT45_19000, partial [Bdellovibrionales bacterium]|nr:hypothetical protein [Bdellovibrionales bacterium]